MKAVILAGGLGTRLKPFTDIIPKPLLPLGGQTIVEIQIAALQRAGFHEIFIATNYRSEFVRAFLGSGSKYGVSIEFSEEEKPLGTCGPLSLLKHRLTEPFIVMNGDVLTNLDLAKFYAECLAREPILTVATKIITTPFRFGNVKVDEEGCVIDVEEKPEFYLEVVAGIYFMRPAVIELIPRDQYYGMDQLIKEMLAQKAKVGRYLIKEYWVDIGQVEDYSQARRMFDEHFAQS
jgi:NDP-sugar pyrophosphorylase family protein